MKLNQNSKQYANDEIMLRTEQREQQMGRNTERTKHKEAETKTSSRRQVHSQGSSGSVASSAAEPHQTDNRPSSSNVKQDGIRGGIQWLVSTLIFRGGGYSRVVKTQSPKFGPTFHFRGGRWLGVFSTTPD